MATKKKVRTKQAEATRLTAQKRSLSPQQATLLRGSRRATARPTAMSTSSRTISPDPSGLHSPRPLSPRPAVTTGAPRPPSHLFRIIRPLAGGELKATWLCLPKKVETLPKHSGPNRSVEGDSVGEGMYRALKSREVSTLQPRDMKMLPQLLIVKTNSAPGTLRHEFDVLECLHEKDGGEGSENFVGSWVRRQQITRAPESSWLILRPIFGSTLQHFGRVSVESRERVPSWFVWHIFLCLIDALEFVHRKGIAHTNIQSKSLMLNPYPPRAGHRFRDYTDVVLIDFGKARTLTEEAAADDVRDMLTVMQEVVDEWSDWAPVSRYVVAGSMNKDPLANFGRELSEMHLGSANINLGDVGKRWSAIAVAEREKGPAQMPAQLLQKAHDDLAREEELRSACEVVLNRFGSAMEEYVRLVGGRRPTAMEEPDGDAGKSATEMEVGGGERLEVEDADRTGVMENNGTDAAEDARDVTGLEQSGRMDVDVEGATAEVPKEVGMPVEGEDGTEME